MTNLLLVPASQELLCTETEGLGRHVAQFAFEESIVAQHNYPVITLVFAPSALTEKRCDAGSCTKLPQRGL